MLIRLYLLYLNKEFFFEWNIYTFNSIKFNFLLLIDYKSLIFIFLVRIIFSIIIIYRIRYIDLSELKMDRFLYLIILFLISIYMLILRPNISIINYFRLRWVRINFLLFSNLLYKNKIIYFRYNYYYFKSLMLILDYY